MSLLTVGITTRNRPAALQACLESLALVSVLRPEVVVFDDGSLPAAVAPEGLPFPTRFIRDASAPGYIAGRNRLVHEARSPYVLLMDDDARLMSAAAIERALAVLEADPRVAAIALAQAEADGRPWPASMQPSQASSPVVVPSFIGFAHVLRRDVFIELGGYRERFGFYGEEKEFGLRLLDAGYRVVFLPDALVHHVPDPASRNSRRYLRFVSRNDCLMSLYNDPLSRVAWVVPARFVLYFRMRRGWKIHDPWGWAWLAREIVAAIPPVWRERRPVSRATRAKWAELRQRPAPYTLPPGPQADAGPA